MMKEKTGIVFGIQHFSIHDGGGIRSNIFLKGCPLRCKWCHNPEGLSPQIDVQYLEGKCIKCGKCQNVYERMAWLKLQPMDVKEKYIRDCETGALEQVGHSMSADEVIEEVLQDQRFFKKSGGGITISGGEPMLQWEFALEILKQAKSENLSTAMETSGYAKWESYEKVFPYVDLFLWDHKAESNERYEELTGVGNKQIEENLRKLYKAGKKIILRCPVIPNVNDTDANFSAIRKKKREMPNLFGCEIMPYHKMGISKAKRIGDEDFREYKEPSKEQIEVWNQRIK